MRLLSKEFLVESYLVDKRSAKQIARECGCSENKIHYWLKKFDIPKRTISDAVYVMNNPNGDPFCFQEPDSSEEWFLYGLGLGLYWGEGNKANTQAVRLGNTDPGLVRKFLEFLENLFLIDKTRLRFGLQIFSDTDPQLALQYWCKELSVSKNQFQKVVVTLSHKKGTYQKKSTYGVLTVYFSNTKLRDTIVTAIEGLRKKPS